MQKIIARTILDSSGFPTVEVDVITAKGLFRASAPNGFSESINEAKYLRDNGCEFFGRSVSQAVSNINEKLGPALLKKSFDVADQCSIDDFIVKEMDPTARKEIFGANATLAVSMAVLKAGAAQKNIPLYEHVKNLAGSKCVRLPVPQFSMLAGGVLAENQLGPQGILIMPTGARSFAEALRMGSEIYQTLRQLIISRYGRDAANVSDKGAFAPNIKDIDEALDLVSDAVRKAQYCGKVWIAIEMNASHMLTKDAKYNLHFKSSKQDPKQWYTAEKLGSLYNKLYERYPICSIEDAFDKDDCHAWIRFNNRCRLQLVGNDLLDSNITRVKHAIATNTCNCLLLRLSQVGSVMEAINLVRICREGNWGVILSHRTGETEDSTIADIAVGINCGQVKFGAPARSERMAKYNQLLRLEEELSCRAVYTGDIFSNLSHNRQ